ncbi:ATPase, BadF/BadG/BcrA/BcrD type [Syntrophomonas zehnderi OL-4]|uniref:ATPase, BadF/BadG/BcrA/BcrD type n=1 Tax=Syntrophomonas zehnderi OL-4 TaxID=690567 RepID=A0A0E4GA17_9FIRM|nr:acyl-CoA dehydratase activase [Syntrophomonas zehnderi]CFX18697.1 ATPase, BadF/BadG/BcrA/BcrD type [Syntrophomonas zehnderi OL-4]
MIGLDLGSRFIKIVQMNDSTITDFRIFDTIDFYRRYSDPGEKSLKINLNQLGFGRNENVVATGYGKVTVQLEGVVHLPEIQAHVRGAVFQTGLADFTLIDIGGQDTKIIQVRGSRAVDFMTNDRCAASSGRYLENMAAVLGLSLEELSLYSLDPVELNSTCAIFGETEIIAKIVEGYSVNELAAGINYSLYRRFAAMLDRLGSDIIVLAGGVAHNQAIGNIISKETASQVVSLKEPQLNGAIGCCTYGEELFANLLSSD